MKTLECSSKGDRRFCSFYAFVDFNGKYKSIENHLMNATTITESISTEIIATITIPSVF